MKQGIGIIDVLLEAYVIICFVGGEKGLGVEVKTKKGKQ